ncbi:hypothetical protein BDV39DRAFT_177387 [Aspergillus sergii]|uniref:Uncharacterized protein n=1 Tax=Aspergillus sergii TaxID=1034303 RepID=A0A5N6WZB0_9EURO|nr:hypothetical protein BDV39DRAFT_177387 [Aspergillus sergii]
MRPWHSCMHQMQKTGFVMRLGQGTSCILVPKDPDSCPGVILTAKSVSILPEETTFDYTTCVSKSPPIAILVLSLMKKTCVPNERPSCPLVLNLQQRRSI